MSRIASDEPDRLTTCETCWGEGHRTVSREESHDDEQCSRCNGTGKVSEACVQLSCCIMVRGDDGSHACFNCGRRDDERCEKYPDIWHCPGDAQGVKGVDSLQVAIAAGFGSLDETIVKRAKVALDWLTHFALRCESHLNPNYTA